MESLKPQDVVVVLKLCADASRRDPKESGVLPRSMVAAALARLDQRGAAEERKVPGDGMYYWLAPARSEFHRKLLRLQSR